MVILCPARSELGEEGESMALKFTARRMSGGHQHEHIARLWWVNPADGDTGNGTRAQLVKWVEDGGKGYAEDARGNNRAYVAVRTSSSGTKYLQTHADSVWTNNLLALPEK